MSARESGSMPSRWRCANKGPSGSPAGLYRTSGRGTATDPERTATGPFLRFRNDGAGHKGQRISRDREPGRCSRRREGRRPSAVGRLASPRLASPRLGAGLASIGGSTCLSHGTAHPLHRRMAQTLRRTPDLLPGSARRRGMVARRRRQSHDHAAASAAAQPAGSSGEPATLAAQPGVSYHAPMTYTLRSGIAEGRMVYIGVGGHRRAGQSDADGARGRDRADQPHQRRRRRARRRQSTSTTARSRSCSARTPPRPSPSSPTRPASSPISAPSPAIARRAWKASSGSSPARAGEASGAADIVRDPADLRRRSAARSRRW